MRVLFGTRNQSKLERMRALFATLGLELVGVDDLPVPEPREGQSVEANAVLKARTYSSVARRPCIANDYGLRLDGFADSDQPNARVRRVTGNGQQASDEEMMTFYRKRIAELGGATRGIWTAALAIAFDSGRVVSTVAQHARTFLSEPSEIFLPGEPLASLQIDPITGKYVSELQFEDRASAPTPIDARYLKFVSSHLRDLSDATPPYERLA